MKIPRKKSRKSRNPRDRDLFFRDIFIGKFLSPVFGIFSGFLSPRSGFFQDIFIGIFISGNLYSRYSGFFRDFYIRNIPKIFYLRNRDLFFRDIFIGFFHREIFIPGIRDFLHWGNPGNFFIGIGIFSWDGIFRHKANSGLIPSEKKYHSNS